jgi:glycosyltransferase involved in cell wall biosynthesis
MATRPLRVGVDARLVGGLPGGLEQFVIGLVGGLSRLTDGDEEFAILAYPDASEWIRPYLGSRCRILPTKTPVLSHWKTWIKSYVPYAAKLRRGGADVLARVHPPTIERSDGTIEAADVDVMHFVLQGAFLTGVPNIYHPHDLQHLHFPEFFSRRERTRRDASFRAFFAQAKMVAVASTWTKRDLLSNYHLPDERVQVIPPGPVLSYYPEPTIADLTRVRQVFDLPEQFVFYPAQTWPHKNHVALLNALAILRDRDGLVVPLVSSGKRNEFYPEIERVATRLRLATQVRFLGFVTPLELRCLYQLCKCVVVPSKLEPGSLPVFEAFWAGSPVACSNVAAMPEQAGGAALLFDPDNPVEIADATKRLWLDQSLRADLIQQGRRRVQHFTWERAARAFRAHYRRISHRTITEEDLTLLNQQQLL